MEKWVIEFYDDFDEEFSEFSENVQDALLSTLVVLQKIGPDLGRPYVDTLKGSKHANMKELRFDADQGVWRLAFAFDPERKAILLIAGDKAGTAQKRFYKRFIKQADDRFDQHLKTLKEK